MSSPVIICVDDESIVLNALKEQLQQEFSDKFIIEVAESGDEALEVVAELIEDQFKIPIVIADFIMPGMTGDELLSNIHQLIPESKKIMLTGQANIEGVTNAINNADLYRFLSKPWDKQDLFLTVREAYKSFQHENLIIEQNRQLKELNANLEDKVEQRTKELKELNATKDKFFSIIAHDLKNPFNTLIGFTELMRDNVQNFNQEKIQEFSNILYQTSKNSYALLKNLLDWSRSQTGRLDIKPEKIDVHELTEENLKLLLNNAEKKNIKLYNEVHPEIFIWADYNMINTVLRNLISNAIKYSHEGGHVKIDSYDEGDKTVVCVTDNGIGIKSDVINRLFRIDEHYTTTGTAKETGTGLGLILCKEFIDKNKGEIWVESTFGQGSSFKFSLPTA